MDCSAAIEKYADYLESNGFRTTTVKTYISCISIIADYLKSRSIDRIESFKGSVAVDFFESKGLLIDYRQFIKYLSAIRQFEKGVLRMEKALIVGDAEKKLFSEARRYRHEITASGSGLSSSAIERKINGLHNKRLRLAMRLGLRAGLRVSEIARLRTEDMEFSDAGSIVINVVDGKGGKDRTVTSLYDPYLVAGIRELIRETKNDRLFYSERYLSTKAEELGFQMHDLRRAFAKELLRREMEKGASRSEAKNKVNLALGHAKKSTTDIYLRKGKRNGCPGKE